MARLLFETHPKRLGRELTPECCIEDVDARLEIFAKRMPECLRTPLELPRPAGFRLLPSRRLRGVRRLRDSSFARNSARQELRASAAVVFEHGFGVVQETASRRSEKDARVRAHLAPEVQPIYSGYYIWRGAPNEPDLSPDTRMTQLGVGIETNADRRSSKLLQTPTGIGFST
jgi:hypothetical protein